MANEHSGVKFFVIYTIVLSLCSPHNVCGKEEEGESPLLEVVQSLLQESARNQKGGSGLSILGGLVQGFMQSEGGRQIGDMLAGSHKGGGAADLISGLGTLWNAARAANPGGGEGDKGEESGFDSAVVGTMMDLFGTLSKAATDGDSQDMTKREAKEEEEEKEEGSVDWEGVLNAAGSLISSMSGNQQKSTGSGFESMLSFLPVLLSSLSGQHNIHASKSIPHHSHEQFLPPVLENLHEYWDHFSKSEFGKSLWENSGLSKLVKLFTDFKGEVEVDKIFESLENNSLRRMWVKSLSSFVAQWVKHLTDPQVQGRYLETVQLICNSFLKTQGYPEKTHIDLNRPADSISALANAVFKKQFNLEINSETYVKPVILYVQEIFKLAKKKGFGVSQLSMQDIESKLSETLDAEVIEPVLRVNRAFRFGSKRKECAQYVICAINKPQDVSKSGLKPGITKLASLAASWFLSTNHNIHFWNLYQAAVEETNCLDYGKMCSEFDNEDLKATTEYFHNEL